ncbi:acyl-CoA dehydrogenase family protein, partial [candidate division KSB1 bacterium]|nr:acyl-CoA dehydrogenase family protein [candidate division KSB1 bacterium]
MDKEEEENLKLILDTVRQFAKDNIDPEAIDRNEEIPKEVLQGLAEMGLFGMSIPEEYGGSGLELRAAGVILETIHASECSGAACHAQMYTMGTVLRHGNEEQKREYLPKIATGELRLQAFGVTEPGTGSDTTQLKTRAEKRGESYVINGQKVWTSRAAHSDLMLLLARTTPA